MNVVYNNIISSRKYIEILDGEPTFREISSEEYEEHWPDLSENYWIYLLTDSHKIDEQQDVVLVKFTDGVRFGEVPM